MYNAAPKARALVLAGIVTPRKVLNVSGLEESAITLRATLTTMILDFYAESFPDCAKDRFCLQLGDVKVAGGWSPENGKFATRLDNAVGFLYC